LSLLASLFRLVVCIDNPRLFVQPGSSQQQNPSENPKGEERT
jgi:hypothetical protein